MGLMRFSRVACAIGAIGSALALPEATDAQAPFFTASMVAATMGWLLFDREIRREMDSRE
jgi:hypothetical protein